MTESSVDVPSNPNELDKILGTASSQRILRILACWNSLSVNELSQKTNISLSQTHLTLKNLEKTNILKKITRGVYSYAENSFAQLLKQAYLSKCEEIVGKELYDLSKLMDHVAKEVFFERYKSLLDLWLPIIESKSKFQLSSLAESVLDMYTH